MRSGRSCRSYRKRSASVTRPSTRYRLTMLASSPTPVKRPDSSKLLISGEAFAKLLDRIRDGTISATAAKEVLQGMAKGEGDADEIIAKRGLKQISDAGAIEKIVDQVLAANAKQVEDYRAGKEKAFNSLVGQVMKATQGKANPAQVNEILKRKLAG